jgi:hypothetical protein
MNETEKKTGNPYYGGYSGLEALEDAVRRGEVRVVADRAPRPMTDEVRKMYENAGLLPRRKA